MFASRVLCGAAKLPAITSKRGNKNFYKGRGAKSMGFINSRGRFTIDVSKLTRHTFIAPDLTGFQLKAYVSPTTPLLGRDGKPRLSRYGRKMQKIQKAKEQQASNNSNTTQPTQADCITQEA